MLALPISRLAVFVHTQFQQTLSIKFFIKDITKGDEVIILKVSLVIYSKYCKVFDLRSVVKTK